MGPERRAVGLFAGVGGIELGLEAAGYSTELLCEIEPGARAVLSERFTETALHDDVATLSSLPDGYEVLTAGFPCQDLSQAGRRAGIQGERSGLVDHVFRLLAESEPTPPRWLVLENVPFMLQLDRGQAMRHLTSELGARGYRWAYRVVDARAFGVPQRRRRVLLVVSKTDDPRPVLFAQDETAPDFTERNGRACGFYWTEGNTGLGWAVDAVPTIKGGSGLGIPSPPAIWKSDGSIATPDIRDAERLQGFEADWTLPAVATAGLRAGARWKLIGNAVCVPMAAWLGTQLTRSEESKVRPEYSPLPTGSRWPTAAWGEGVEAFSATVGEWPVSRPWVGIETFLNYPTSPLSERATNGFRNRLAASSLRYPDEFMRDLSAAAG